MSISLSRLLDPISQDAGDGKGYKIAPNHRPGRLMKVTKRYFTRIYIPTNGDHQAKAACTLSGLLKT